MTAGVTSGLECDGRSFCIFEAVDGGVTMESVADGYDREDSLYDFRATDEFAAARVFSIFEAGYDAGVHRDEGPASLPARACGVALWILAIVLILALALVVAAAAIAAAHGLMTGI